MVHDILQEWIVARLATEFSYCIDVSVPTYLTSEWAVDDRSSPFGGNKKPGEAR